MFWSADVDIRKDDEIEAGNPLKTRMKRRAAVSELYRLLRRADSVQGAVLKGPRGRKLSANGFDLRYWFSKDDSIIVNIIVNIIATPEISEMSGLTGLTAQIAQIAQIARAAVVGSEASYPRQTVEDLDEVSAACYS